MQTITIPRVIYRHFASATSARLDGKGDGTPCGGGWISKRKKGSKKGAQKLAASLKAGDKGAIARVQAGKKKAGDRQSLSRAVIADKGKKARDIPVPPPAQTKAKRKPKAKAAPKTYSGAAHPKTWKAGDGGSDKYQPKEWLDGGSGRGMNFNITQNGFGQYWPNASFAKPDGSDGYKVTIRDSNPFSTFAGATKFVEKTIARIDERAAKKAAREAEFPGVQFR